MRWLALVSSMVDLFDVVAVAALPVQDPDEPVILPLIVLLNVQVPPLAVILKPFSRAKLQVVPLA